MILPPAFLVTLVALFAFTRARASLTPARYVLGNVQCVAEPSTDELARYLSSESPAAPGARGRRRRRVVRDAPPNGDITVQPAATVATRVAGGVDGDSEGAAALRLLSFPARSVFERQRARRQELERDANGGGGAPPSVLAALRKQRAQQLRQLDLLPFQYELELQGALLAHLLLLLVATGAQRVTGAALEAARPADAVQYAALTLGLTLAYVNGEMLHEIGWASGETKASIGLAVVGFVLATAVPAASAPVARAGVSRPHSAPLCDFSLVQRALARAAHSMSRTLQRPVAGVQGMLRLLTSLVAAILGACVYVPAVRRAHFLCGDGGASGGVNADTRTQTVAAGGRRERAWRARAQRLVVYVDLLGGAPLSLLWLRPFRRVTPTGRALACATLALLRLAVVRIYLQTHLYQPVHMLRALRARALREGAPGATAGASGGGGASSRTPAAVAERRRAVDTMAARIRTVRYYMCSSALQYASVPVLLLACAAMSAVAAQDAASASAPLTPLVLGAVADVWLWWLLVADAAVVVGTLVFGALSSMLEATAARAVGGASR